MRSVTRRAAWYAAVATAGVLIILSVVLAVFDPSVHRYVLRLYDDPSFLRDILLRFGVLGPVVFIVIQALQVIIAPIPGEITGLLGGFVFGQWLGFVYSTLGLTVGSLFAFGIGRWLGETFVRRAVSETLWRKLGFILDAEGTLLCFIIYLIPGLPKDIVCYLFGLSPMPFWVFAVASTLGRMPGTWALSAQGAKVASGDYYHLILLTAIITAVALPLYVYRSKIMSFFSRRRQDRPRSDRRCG
jgi:uncharacterized membrane protein YdjX (TVP38/TMEM64 family)